MNREPLKELPPIGTRVISLKTGAIGTVVGRCAGAGMPNPEGLEVDSYESIEVLFDGREESTWGIFLIGNSLSILEE